MSLRSNLAKYLDSSLFLLKCHFTLLIEHKMSQNINWEIAGFWHHGSYNPVKLQSKGITSVEAVW